MSLARAPDSRPGLQFHRAGTITSISRIIDDQGHSVSTIRFSRVTIDLCVGGLTLSEKALSRDEIPMTGMW